MQRVLLTTPDYPPKRGGLATFTLNIETSLKNLKIPYDLLVWENVKALKQQQSEILKRKPLFINIHYMGGYFLDPHITCKHINFVHGSEILFHSPNILKKIVKNLMKKSMLSYMQNADCNFFISQFTRDKLTEQGLELNYSRDIVLHNAIEVKNSELVQNSWPSDCLKLVCIARDVPHKNLVNVVRFCEILKEISGCQIELSLNSSAYTSNKIQVRSIDLMNDLTREELYKSSHFNLLLSLDQSKRGFFEGFGLTTLEAARYGTPSIVLATGGLPENVHDGYNGFVLQNIEHKDLLQLWNKLICVDYLLLRKKTFDHTQTSHSLKIYEMALGKLLYD